MGKPTGFLEYERRVSEEIAPLERIKNFNEFHIPLPLEKQQLQGARCMACGVPFCQSGKLLAGMASGCPLHNLVPEWNDLIYNGNWKEAYDAAERILVQKSTLEDLNDPEAKLPNNYTSAEMITAYEFFNDDVTSASILIPVRVDPTFTELQTRSVFAIACGIDSIRSLSAGVIPLLTSAE